MKKRGGLFKFLLLVLIVGGGIYLAITLWPKNTSAVFNAVSAQVNGGMLDQTIVEEGEDDNFNSLFNKYYDAVKISLKEDSFQEIENFRYSYNSLAIMAKFYEQNISFADVNKTFNKNKKTVTKNLKKANELAEDMYDYMQVTLDTEVKNTSWAEYSWKNYRIKFKSVLNYYNKAYTALTKIYKDCLPESAINHNLTYLVLDASNSYLSLTIENFDEKNDYASSMYEFVNIYLNEKFDRSILQYQFNAQLRENATLIYKVSKNGLRPDNSAVEAYALYDQFLKGQGGFVV